MKEGPSDGLFNDFVASFSLLRIHYLILLTFKGFLRSDIIPNALIPIHKVKGTTRESDGTTSIPVFG